MALPSPYRRQITSSVGVPAPSAMKLDLGVDSKSAQTTRRAPCAANARAIARPRSDDEPVTTHTFSRKRVPVLEMGRKRTSCSKVAIARGMSVKDKVRLYTSSRLRDKVFAASAKGAADYIFKLGVHWKIFSAGTLGFWIGGSFLFTRDRPKICWGV